MAAGSAWESRMLQVRRKTDMAKSEVTRLVVLAIAAATCIFSAMAQNECRLTFSGYEGSETLKDFPALIKIPDGLTGFDYKDSAADGSDLAFFGADGKPLAFEIDTWDPEGTSYVWVRVPEVTTATTITAKWGVSCAKTFTSSPHSVWSDDYLAVWHFSKFRNGVTFDSKNGLAAELRGRDMRKFIHADAYVGKGYFCSSKATTTGSYLQVADDPRWTAYSKTGKLAVSFLVNSTMDKNAPNEDRHQARIVCNKAIYADKLGFEVAARGGEYVWSCGQGDARFAHCVERQGGSDMYSFRDTWAHVTVTFDGTNGGESVIYYNGRPVASAKGAAYAPTITGLPLAIGHYAEALVYERQYFAEYFCGYLDEVRLAKAMPSADRIRADYLTLTHPTQFAVAEGGKVAKVIGRRLAAGDTPPVAPDVSSWRGVNAVTMFYAPWNRTEEAACGRYFDSEFALFRKLGLNFARVMMDYRFFISADDWEHWLEDGLAKVDDVVEYGRRHGIHVSLNLVRAPGKVAFPAEPGVNTITTDKVALEAFKRIWAEFARRYRGIPNSELSFNPLNEPSWKEADFIRVFDETIAAIRKEDPGRFVVLDGNDVGKRPVPHFFKVPLTAQAFRGYQPHRFTHCGVWYGGAAPFSVHWPKGPEDKAMQWVTRGLDWEMNLKNGIPKGYPAMIGEFGVYAKVDHASALKFIEHQTSEWRKRGFGWAIWDYDGRFGFVDSDRKDAEYIEVDGRKIDKKMLDLLRAK